MTAAMSTTRGRTTHAAALALAVVLCVASAVSPTRVAGAAPRTPTVTTGAGGAASTAAATRTPVIVLHGITGAFLRNPSGEVWPREGETARSLSDDHLDVLRLRADGRTPFSTTDPDYQISVDRAAGVGGLIDQVELCVLSACAGLSQVYGPTFAHLQSTGYRQGVDLVPFAFDWRRDVTTNAGLLLAEIDRVRKRTGAAKVNLLAHSQGGLVVRAALGDARAVGKVDRVATLGTPTLGATQFLGVLDHQEPCQSTELFGGCVLNRARAQALVTNWPGALALLPSPGYFSAYRSPVNRLVDDDGDGRVEGYLSPAAVRGELADRNLPLIDQATALHQRIDPWAPADPAVRLTRFVGTGLGTIERVEEYMTEQCSGALWWRSCSMVEASRLQLGNGDGTVPQHSADVYNPATGFDLRGSGTNRYVAGVSHGDLPTSTGVLDAVVTFFQASPTAAPLARAGAAAPSTTAQDADEATPGVVAGSRPRELAGVEVTALGAVDAQVLDSAGRRTGTLDRLAQPLTEEIPGSTASAGDDHATVFLTAQDRYGATWRARRDGDVVLQLRSFDGDVASSVRAFGPLRLSAGATMSVDMRGPQRLGVLPVTIDDDADGDVDRRERVRPAVTGAGAGDDVAPEVDVSLRPLTDGESTGLVEVTVEASDRGGAGVDRVEYGLDPSGRAGSYDGPFVVPATGELHVRAVDRAGNVSAPYVTVRLG